MLQRGFEWGVAKRYLLRPPKDGYISLNTILSVIAIMLAVTALIVVMSVMNGFRAGLIESILGYQGHAVVQGYGGRLSSYDDIYNESKALPGVVKVRYYTEHQVMLTRDGRSTGAIVRGLPPEQLTEDGLGDVKILAGQLNNDADTPGLVLGFRLARKLGVTVGDTVTVVSPNTVSTPFGSTLRYLGYRVDALVEIGLFQFDDSFVGMPLDEAQRFFQMGEAISKMDIYIEDPDRIGGFLPLLEQTVGGKAYMFGWRSFNPSLLEALKTERIAMFLILCLIIVVAVFNVSSSLVMLVKDKSGDIAIMRTMGAQQASIRKIFLIVGLSVGAFGVLLGGALAALIIENIVGIKEFIEWAFGFNAWDPATRWISEIRADVDWTETILIIVVALVLSFLATILPAFRASRLDPVTILRHE